MTDSPAREPRGFAVHTAPVGLADDGRDDFTVLFSTEPAVVSAVFTRSRFVGPSVTLSRAADAGSSSWPATRTLPPARRARPTRARYAPASRGPSAWPRRTC
jgi:hypothetical protein